MRFIANEYNEDVIATFNPTGLVIAATLLKTSGGPVVTPDSLPAGLLFDKTTLAATDGGYFLFRYGVKVAFIEDSSAQGSKWRYYNHPDKTQATITYLLVDGDPQHDLCEVNLIVDVVKLENGIVQILNSSIINGNHYSFFTPNQTAQRIGFQYTLNNLQDVDSYSGLTYLPAGGRSFNQAGSQREYINLTTDPSIPISTDKDGASQMATHADYCIKQADLDDANIELFGIKMVWLTGGNPKNESETMFIPLKDILA